MKLYSLEGGNQVIGKAWYPGIRTVKLAKAVAFQIFSIPVTRNRPEYTSTITQIVCSDCSVVFRLGHIVTDNMNRMPVDVKASIFTDTVKGSSFSRLRRFIDVVSLLRWEPKFDFRTLPKNFVNRPTGRATTTQDSAYMVWL